GGRGRGAPNPHRSRHGLRAARAVTLRTRLTLVAAGVVAIVVALASITTYFVMRHELYSQVDTQLEQHAEDPHAGVPNFSEFSGDYVAFVTSDGSETGDHIPVDDDIAAVAGGRTPGFFRNSHALLPSGEPTIVRERVRPYEPGVAVVVA